MVGTEGVAVEANGRFAASRGTPSVLDPACAGRTGIRRGARETAMLGSIRALLRRIITLVIAIVTFPLRLLRSLL